MRDYSSWSLYLGRWAGVQVRLHAFFLLFGIFALYVSTLSPADDAVQYGLAALGILLLSVVVHEIGHCLAALRLGGTVEQIVIGPLGGLAPISFPHEPRREAMAASAGPAVNLTIFLMTGSALSVWQGEISGLLNPLQPRDLIEGPQAAVLLKITCWINWVLFWVNVLPAFPMDGGPALRAWLTPIFGYRTSVLVVARAAKLTAVGMCGIAWLTRDAFPESLVPAWVPLLVFAVFLFFSAKQESQRLREPDNEDDLLGYDFSQGYTSLENHLEQPKRSDTGTVRRWLDTRREAKRRRLRELEAEEERRVDDVLARLHAGGMQALSAEERDLLERVSARYRNRQRS